jgi:lipoprotein-anchoring transpeptidase ErfK/SrfK
MLWVQQGQKTVMPAIHIRTGRAGFRTPDGSFRIYLRNKTQWSRLFNEPMPYSLFFFRSFALHGTYQDVHKGGSNGCVNLTLADAQHLWNVLGKGDLVYIWGHKSGT